MIILVLKNNFFLLRTTKKWLCFPTILKITRLNAFRVVQDSLHLGKFEPFRVVADGGFIWCETSSPQELSHAAEAAGRFWPRGLRCD